ncbi:MAG TPA: hypothetical protein VN678_10105 [Acidobacteriaceae bacterium]|nr:hypothetical protein [Acidobacteriaceae bacterium]
MEDTTNQKRSGLEKIWFGWRITWAILTNLIYFALLLLAFDKAESAFEILALALLVLIYQAVNWSNTARARTDVEEALVQRRLTFAVLQKLGENTVDAEELINDLELKFKRNNPIYYINLLGATIVYVFLLYKLIATLL